ncbi:MAG: GTPase HflX [candidate division Zixibacteria bacterium]|nr:GTPase HflX [candidate division Zixibacteria bacterium]
MADFYETVNEDKTERAILVGVKLPRTIDHEFDESLKELRLLATSAGAKVQNIVTQERKKIDAAYFIGKGKVSEIRDLAESERANVVIFDEELTPAQIRNLENRLDIKVIDRTTLILDIFVNRAKTNEAKAQVELAQLNHLLPRLTRQWTHLSKQYGGIGTKGPGETQLETDRRLINNKIKILKKKLKKIDNERITQRKNRLDLFRVCLVGYTNAGKSTLFNCLTKSGVTTENRLFSTLDSTTRKLSDSNGHKVLMTDTVGFINKLPHQLVASFKSTLDEVRLSSLLIHVVDFSHPHYLKRIANVNEVLSDIGADKIPMIMAFNKIDKSPEPYAEFGHYFTPDLKNFFLSAIKKEGVKHLIKRITYLADDNNSV